jgi:hypothetical protein
MEGDPAAREAVTETATYLGVGIANAVWALDAEAVVINGALTEAWPLVSAAIREQFPTGRQFLNFRSLLLRPSSLGGEASILGALALPFLNVFLGRSTTGKPSMLDRPRRITASDQAPNRMRQHYRENPRPGVRSWLFSPVAVW